MSRDHLYSVMIGVRAWVPGVYVDLWRISRMVPRLFLKNKNPILKALVVLRTWRVKRKERAGLVREADWGKAGSFVGANEECLDSTAGVS